MDRSSGSDPILAPFLRAPDESSAAARLGELLLEHASPLLATILGRQLGASATAEELEDVEAGGLLRLQQQLLALRAGEGPAIASFDDYAAMVAFHAAHGWLRERRPERHRFRQRLRYLIERETSLATWTGPTRERLCGLARHRDRPATARAARIASVAATAALGGRSAADLARWVRRTLENLDEPCRLEDLTDALAPLAGVHDTETVSLQPAQDEPQHAEPASAERSALARLEDRELMTRLWREIGELPLRQRQALLLNLRDARGGDLVGLTLAAGVIDRKRLGELLGESEDRIDALLPDLPREDLWIAERLGATRQQVINLRKSARLRLARRLRSDLATGGTTGPLSRSW